MTDKTGGCPHRAGHNLGRLMADLGLTVEQVAEQSGLDRRTVRGILDGANRPHLRTIGRLAKGLEVSADEFFLEPAQLLYRRFDRHTNPVVEEVIEAHPKVFSDWTAVDFEELHSRFGTGGPLTAEGALAAAQQMNAHRKLHEKLSVVLESSQAEVIAGIVELMYERVVDEHDREPR